MSTINVKIWAFPEKNHKIKGYENKENCPTTIEHHSIAEIWCNTDILATF